MGIRIHKAMGYGWLPPWPVDTTALDRACYGEDEPEIDDFKAWVKANFQRIHAAFPVETKVEATHADSDEWLLVGLCRAKDETLGSMLRYPIGGPGPFLVSLPGWHRYDDDLDYHSEAEPITDWHRELPVGVHPYGDRVTPAGTILRRDQVDALRFFGHDVPESRPIVPGMVAAAVAWMEEKGCLLRPAVEIVPEMRAYVAVWWR